jgi:fructosamine-3-kinase
MSVSNSIEQAIAAATGESFTALSTEPVSGGCINDAVCLRGADRRFFVKLNHIDELDMFAAEAAGLRAILDSNCLRAPQPVCHGISEGRSFLVLEFIDMIPPGEQASRELGEKLAVMHGSTGSSFGWVSDNYIGTTPQQNPQTDNWIDFVRDQRLGFQLALAQGNGAPAVLFERGQRLMQELPALFGGYRPAPSLLHGDLWGGNWGCAADGSPVIFDPAIYYGDREADIAMTELFGGFDDRFYQSYRQAWTLDPGYSSRKVLYNLYHILNHYNLFGGGYAGQALGMIDRLISEIS